MKIHIRDNLIKDKYNVGVGLVYLANYVIETKSDSKEDTKYTRYREVSHIRAYWGNQSKAKVYGSHWYGNQNKLAKKYLNGIPDYYFCHNCKMNRIKLWREYCSSYIKLLCANCAEENQKEWQENNWESGFKKGKGDQIGWFIPAVPTKDKSYWGYSSVPYYACLWWKRLPVKNFYFEYLNKDGSINNIKKFVELTFTP